MMFMMTVGLLGFLAGFVFGVWLCVDTAKGDLAVVKARNAELNELLRAQRLRSQRIEGVE